MADRIYIQLMDRFAIYVNDHELNHMFNKSRKGAALITYLILNGGTPVPNQRLLSTFWPDENSINPVSSLKTLISRMRLTLNQISEGLGNCIVAERGAYYWRMLPDMRIDVNLIEGLFEQLERHKGDVQTCKLLFRQLMDLYKGDLLQNSDHNEWALTRATSLHSRYITAIYAYVDMLRDEENYDEIINVCRLALDVDNFDDHLHMELMSALIKTNRGNEALIQYKHVMHLHYRYLGIQPSEEMQEFYKQIVNAGKTLEFNLESIRNELREVGEQRGAFICEYAVFKEIYNLQIRNLERLGATMLLAVIMVSDISGQPMDSIKQENVMNGLMEILRNNMRKGDTIAHFSPTILALLLPTANYSSGDVVMERIKRLFYRKYPNSNVSFNYRVGPLSSDAKTYPKETEVWKDKRNNRE